MKEGLIRITGEKDIFYDSFERVYRYRMHCPNCGKVISICRCYQDIDDLLMNIDDGIANYTCSSKCELLIGEWDEIGEAMQALDLSRDLKECVSEITDEQLKECLRDYEIGAVLIELYNNNSEMPISHLKNPTRAEQEEILFVMGDIKDVLWNLDRSYCPDISELTEEQASQVLTILTEDGDFDYPQGEDCTI